MSNEKYKEYTKEQLAKMCHKIDSSFELSEWMHDTRNELISYLESEE